MTRRRRLVASAFGTTWLCVAALGACSRDAEIREDFEWIAGPMTPPAAPPLPDGGIPISVTLTGGDAGACAARPDGPCVGPTDFQCQGQRWLEQIATDCRQQIGCRAGNWISIHFDFGCVDLIGMVEPEDAFLECLTDAVEQYSCPCVDQGFAYFLGVAEDGCRTGG